MTKTHPAMRILKRKIVALGCKPIDASFHEVKIIGDNMYPCWVALELSAHENKARIRVSSLYDNCDKYATLAVLHNEVFTF